MLLAPTETAVTLHGYADAAPSVNVTSGQADPVQYDPATKHFTVSIKPDPNSPLDKQVDPVRHLTVVFKEAHS